MIPKQGAELIRAHRERWEDARRERRGKPQTVRASTPHRLTPLDPWIACRGEPLMERRRVAQIQGGVEVWERRRIPPDSGTRA